MPPLNDGPLYPWFKRWIPEKIFYVVPALMWLAQSVLHRSLTLPTAANPSMEVGGLWGERKSQGIALFGSHAVRYAAPAVSMIRTGDPAATEDMQTAARLLQATAISFPLIAKPERGYQGWGVKVLDGPECLHSYLRATAAGTELMLQKLVLLQGECGLFYVREPGAGTGRIVSLALTFAPHVVGNGEARLCDLVDANPILRKNRDIYRPRLVRSWERIVPPDEVVVLTNARAARMGAVYRDASDLVTDRLASTIDAIARDIPGFHFGRFDIRFRSLEALLEGEDFMIVELNGAGAEMLHLWDGRKGLREAYMTLWRQYRCLFGIAASNRRRGAKPDSLLTMVALQRRQERLRRSYPPSD